MLRQLLDAEPHRQCNKTPAIRSLDRLVTLLHITYVTDPGLMHGDESSFFRTTRICSQSTELVSNRHHLLWLYAGLPSGILRKSK